MTHPTAGILTRRQWQMLRLAAQGYGNHHIADALELGPKTVENYFTGIYAELGLNFSGHALCRARAILWYWQQHGELARARLWDT